MRNLSCWLGASRRAMTGHVFQPPEWKSAACLVVLPQGWANGHERPPLGPRQLGAHCPGARAAHPDRAARGQLTVACRVPGCRPVWYSPPHEPGTGLVPGVSGHLWLLPAPLRWHGVREELGKHQR